MSDYSRHLEEQLKDPAFAAEWERQRPEREYVKAVIAARMEMNLTQKELVHKTGKS